MYYLASFPGQALRRNRANLAVHVYFTELFLGDTKVVWGRLSEHPDYALGNKTKKLAANDEHQN